MNREDIIRMAREAGFYIHSNEIYSMSTQSDHELTEPIERFAALVASAEREACAVAAEKESLRGLPEEQPEGEELLRACAQIAGGVLIADAIRARGHS